jgi:hypothetical protein
LSQIIGLLKSAETFLMTAHLIVIIYFAASKVEVLNHIFEVFRIDLIDSELVLLLLNIVFLLILRDFLQGEATFEGNDFVEFVL